MNTDSKIGVFMWYDSNIKDYAEINYQINKIYCDKYGYDIIKSDVRRYPERKPHWERIPFILEYFDKYDYLIWIDADAHFHVDSPPITNVTKTYPDKIFIFSGDTDVGNKKLTCEINSGFFIVKPTEESKNILKRWMDDEDLFQSPKLKKPIFGRNKWNDQAVLRIMYSENILNICDNSIIIDYGILQHFNKKHKLKQRLFELTSNPFVFHCTNGDMMKYDNRVKHSKEYYNNIQFVIYKKYMNSNIQLAKPVINDILVNCENKKMLVFGLGHDSELWYNATNTNTLFIENNETYIDLNKNIDPNNIIYYDYQNISVNSSLDLTETQISEFKIPEKILENAPFDIILINGPNGYNDNCPGTLLPIYWSKHFLSKEETIIYLDNASRNLEKKSINKYFLTNKKNYFKERHGTMKIII